MQLLAPASLALGLFAATLAAQEGRVLVRELSGPMAVAPERSSEDFAVFSPDGQRLLYSVRLLESDARRLGSALADPASPALLLNPAGGEDVTDYLWASDGARALFVEGGRELFSAPPDGSAAPVRIVPPVGELPAGSLTDLRSSADGARAIYRTGGGLFSVPTAGGVAPTQLSGALTVVSAALAGGGRLVFLATTNHLYSAPVDGSAPALQLTTVPTAGLPAQVDAPGDHAVFLSAGRLWSVPVDGSATPFPLTGFLPAFSTVTHFQVSPSANQVVYRADAVVDERYELFVTDTDGNPGLNAVLEVPNGGTVLTPWRFSQDGTSILASAIGGVPLQARFYAAPVDGTGAVELHAASVTEFEVSSDSAWVVFARGIGGFQEELVSVPISGGALQTLSPAFGVNALDLYRATSTEVVYIAEQGTPGKDELFAVPIDPVGPPPAPTLLSGVLGPAGDVTSFHLDPLEGFVVFAADADVDAESRLHRSELAGLPLRRTYSTLKPAATVGDVLDHRARRGLVVYVADQDVADQIELYAVAQDGHQPPWKLSGAMVDGGDVLWTQATGATLEFSSDAARVGFLADREVDGTLEAWSVAVDGLSAPVRLNGPLVAGTSVAALRAAPDGARYVYVANEAATPGQRLYSVPAAGGSATALASLPSLALPFAITSDSSRVLYVNGRLFGVSITGGTPVDLSDSVQQLLSFQAGPSRAVFLARASAGAPVRLYSKALVGGTRLTLSPSLVAGGNVSTFTLSTDGTRVLFLADALVDEHFLLYSVLADGSAPAVLLHDSLLEALAFRTAGSRVAYALDRPGFGFDDSYGVADLDGQDPVTLLTTYLETPDFLLSPDGATVVIREGLELRAYPASGGASTLLAEGTAFPLAFTPGGRRLAVSDSSAVRRRDLADGQGPVLVEPGLTPALHFTFVHANAWVFRSEALEPGVIRLYGGVLHRTAMR